MKRILLLLVVFILFPSVLLAADSLLVFAGAGMRLPLDVIGKKFEEKYHVQVIYDYEGSGRLGNKILAGQTPDVYIPGSERWAKILKKKDYVKDYFPIAYHIPVIVTPLNNEKVKSLKDFLRHDVTLVLGDPKACAIGKVSQKIFKKAGLREDKMNIVARGVTVKQLVHWIEGNNADASIVWHADAVQSGKVRIVEIPKEVNAIALIPICTMTKTSHPEIAKKYVDFVLKEGKKIFADFGFKVAE
ncbi:molybdenum ABC transporter, periplasmic molybdate-binding protein [Thermodesulfatator indicus DSM 15286]|uniref:Molybdenum ABC transporter, periplasmic molybdate-binding protein n=1 Tax=Thermodesulfatator indicus (strain DSM 15286 / JCM 11887 / CIR29812) TaxID=667014 RepID=F8AB05_THEID|nr:molybdate ABC transporter substrate-binding protein [Thermodesulfatator indicus]AEH44371.1 molybdenum ABC transporter, periplasmic molybdate-binding protein [Thermodesulfatator indicus DSM 15286]